MLADANGTEPREGDLEGREHLALDLRSSVDSNESHTEPKRQPLFVVESCQWLPRRSVFVCFLDHHGRQGWTRCSTTGRPPADDVPNFGKCAAARLGFGKLALGIEHALDDRADVGSFAPHDEFEALSGHEGDVLAGHDRLRNRGMEGRERTRTRRGQGTKAERNGSENAVNRRTDVEFCFCQCSLGTNVKPAICRTRGLRSVAGSVEGMAFAVDWLQACRREQKSSLFTVGQGWAQANQAAAEARPRCGRPTPFAWVIPP